MFDSQSERVSRVLTTAAIAVVFGALCYASLLVTQMLQAGEPSQLESVGQVSP